MKTRKDRWTPEQDEMLKEIVENSMRDGKTKKMGIEIASKKLKRSTAACAYRFYDMNKNDSTNNLEEVVSNHVDNTDNVEHKKSVFIVENNNTTTQRNVTIESIMDDIQTLLLQNKDNEEMKQRNEELERRNQELESKLSSINAMFDTLKSLNI